MQSLAVALQVVTPHRTIATEVAFVRIPEENRELFGKKQQLRDSTHRIKFWWIHSDVKHGNLLVRMFV